MKKLVHFFLLVLVGASAFGQSSQSTYIRQLPNSGGVYDTTVGPNGTGSYVSPMSVTELNTFQLWAQRINPPDWTLIQTLSLDPYDPTVLLTLNSPDTVNPLRTRVDIAYTVQYSIVFPIFTGQIFPDTVLRNGVDLYNATGMFGWLPNTPPNGDPWYVNGNSTVSVLPQTTTTYEHWWLDRQQATNALYKRYAEVAMRIIPRHSVSYTGIPPATVYNSSSLNTVITILNLYPTSSSHLLIITPTNPAGDVYEDYSQNVTDPYMRTIQVPWTTALTVQGTYTLELWTWTSVAGWEQIPLTPPITFYYDPEIKLDADIYVP